MTRHKPRGRRSGLRRDSGVPRGTRRDGRSDYGLVRRDDTHCGRRRLRAAGLSNSVDRTLLVVVYSGVLCPELPYLRHTRHST